MPVAAPLIHSPAPSTIQRQLRGLHCSGRGRHHICSAARKRHISVTPALTVVIRSARGQDLRLSSNREPIEPASRRRPPAGEDGRDSPHPCAIHGSARPAERLDSTALGRRSLIRMGSPTRDSRSAGPCRFGRAVPSSLTWRWRSPDPSAVTHQHLAATFRLGPWEGYSSLPLSTHRRNTATCSAGQAP